MRSPKPAARPAGRQEGRSQKVKAAAHERVGAELSALGRDARLAATQRRNARASSAAHIATAVFASSSTLPMVMKPWIWRSKQT